MSKLSGFSHALETAGGVFSHRRRPRYVYLCAFFLPFLIMSFLWAIHKVAPFGSKMILAHDQWHQYYPFYLDLRRRLLSGGSLFHSWTTGMGTSYLPLFAYYLASPLNYLAALLPESLAMYYYTFTVILRICLAGLFFAFFLNKTFDRSELINAVFSTAYALCAFLMGYYWNAIWLDTIALLPLVVLGTISLLRDRRCVLYTFSLFLSVFCSYYIGLFTCIFVLLLFIGWHIVNWDSLGGFFSRFFRIALCTAVAIGMTAVLTIPAFLGLQATSSAVNKFPDGNAMNMVSSQTVSAQETVDLLTKGEEPGIWDFFGAKPPSYSEEQEITVKWAGFGAALNELKHFRIGGFFRALSQPLSGFKAALSNTGVFIEPTTMEGLPNIFCGFSTLLLALLFLFCRQIPLKERLYTLFLLIFFLASFVHRPLDYLWHGMHFPNMLPYRFSFLWCFTIIYMAYRVWTELDHVRFWRALLILPPAALVTWCVVSGQEAARTDVSTLLAAFFTLALILLFCMKVIRREHLALGLALCLITELCIGAALGVNKVSVTDSVYYPTQGESSEAVIELMNEREKDTVDLWRAEVALKQSLNDGTLLGYNGISVFSSAANSKISEFLQGLGLAASVAGNRYSYQEADPFTNLLLNLKYLIDRNGRNVDSAYFRQVASDGQVVLLENQAYLPMGLLVKDELREYETANAAGLPYERLNRFFQLMTGSEDSLYTSLNAESIDVLGSAETTYKTATSFGAKCESADEENCIEAAFVMPQDGHLCVYSKSSNTSDLVWFLNGERQYTYGDKYGYNRYMGYFSKGDRISIRYRPQSGKTASVTVGGALFDAEVFDRTYAALSDRTMLLTEVSDTRIEGVVHAAEPGLLYTSIPYDAGWTLTVDEQPAKITAVDGAMIAFHLEKGVHTIELNYEAPGFSLGLQISLFCLAGFLVLVILALLGRFSRPPIVKVPMKLADPREEVPDVPAPVPAPITAEPPAGTTMPPLIPGSDPEPAPAPDPGLPASATEARPGQDVPDRPTHPFTPVSGKTEGGQPAPGTPPAGGEAPQTEEPPAEIYTIEELDRLLHGLPPEKP